MMSLARGETELQMVQRHILRATQLVVDQRRRVLALKGQPEYEFAVNLLEQLEWALELHKQHLAELLRN